MAYNLRQSGPTYMKPRFMERGPTITNNAATVGSVGAVATVLNASPAVGARVTYAYQWYRGSQVLAASTIANATSASYSIIGSDRTASAVTLVATLTNPHGAWSRTVVYPVTLG
jgi:hypothetical protein